LRQDEEEDEEEDEGKVGNLCEKEGGFCSVV
jgi:hypothetical protein